MEQKTLKEKLIYNPATGLFVWSRSRGSGAVGKQAGYLRKDGYVYVGINGRQYLSHRLAWLYTYGYLPENQIDHIDRVKHNNAIINLREVSRSCNRRNTGIHANNTSGVKGVYFSTRSKKWRAQITINGTHINIGSYSNMMDAVVARHEAEIKSNYQYCNTTSTAFQYIKKSPAMEL